MSSIWPPRTVAQNYTDYWYWRCIKNEPYAATLSSTTNVDYYAVTSSSNNAYHGINFLANTGGTGNVTFPTVPLFKNGATSGTTTLSWYTFLTVNTSFGLTALWNPNNSGGPGLSFNGAGNNSLSIVTQGSNVTVVSLVNLSGSGAVSPWMNTWIQCSVTCVWPPGTPGSVNPNFAWSVTHPSAGTFTATQNNVSQVQKPVAPYFYTTTSLSSNGISIRDVRIDYT